MTGTSIKIITVTFTQKQNFIKLEINEKPKCGEITFKYETSSSKMQMLPTVMSLLAWPIKHHILCHICVI